MAKTSSKSSKRKLPIVPPDDADWLRSRMEHVAQANPTGSTKHDPAHMRSIATRVMARENPAKVRGNQQLAMRLNVVDVALEAQAAGKNLSSLSPEEYHDLLLSQGVGEDKALALVEELASWGVTDDI